MSAAPGRPQASSHRSAQHEGTPVSAASGWLGHGWKVLGAMVLTGLTLQAMAQSKPAGAAMAAPATAKATFAGGCFWCVESDFDKIPGVISTTSGYTGGKTANPSYEQVSSHTTGHAEAVEVVFGRDVDAMRERLRNLGADDQVVEGLIVPLTYVRDSLDVGHSKIAPLPQPDYETIHDYAVRAENGVTWLLDLLVSRIIDGTFEVSSYSPDPDRVATLFTKLREYQAVRVDPYAAGATSEVSP